MEELNKIEIFEMEIWNWDFHETSIFRKGFK